MGHPQLDNLVRAGALKSELCAQSEFDGLVHSGVTRLADAKRAELALESQFDLAYNAGHALALAALRWHGYRSEKRYTVFQTLTHTVGFSAEQWRVLSLAHDKRNLAEYEGRVDINASLVDAMFRVIEELEKRVLALGPVA